MRPHNLGMPAGAFYRATHFRTNILEEKLTCEFSAVMKMRYHTMTPWLLLKERVINLIERCGLCNKKRGIKSARALCERLAPRGAPRPKR